MDSEESAQAPTWYMKGRRLSEQPQLVHATVPRGDGVFVALCDAQGVVPMGGRFDPADGADCQQCRNLAA